MLVSGMVETIDLPFVAAVIAGLAAALLAGDDDPLAHEADVLVRWVSDQGCQEMESRSMPSHSAGAAEHTDWHRVGGAGIRALPTLGNAPAPRTA